MSKTPVINQQQATEQWLVIDAKDQILGRLATRIAGLLRSKGSAQFTPHVPTKTHVIVVNAAALKVTGAKLLQKKYYRHTSRPGSLKERTLAEQLAKRPTKPLEDAVAGMLPKNKLRDVWLNHLHLYAEDTHPHEAQKPEEVENV